MAIRFRCPCGEKVKVRDGADGRYTKCPHCLAVLHVPDDGKSTYDTVAVAVALVRDDAHSGGAAPAGSVEAKAAEVSTDAESAKVLILVADSNAKDRRMTAQMLQERNYAVLEAEDGPRALELIRAERPAAALLNVKLDILSGFQVVQQLRSPSNILNKDVWTTPVLMTTERLLGRDKQYSMSIGAHGYFVKPLEPSQICPKLERITAKQHSD
jgi:CheY-like chemotaxis protein